MDNLTAIQGGSQVQPRRMGLLAPGRGDGAEISGRVDKSSKAQNGRTASLTGMLRGLGLPSDMEEDDDGSDE